MGDLFAVRPKCSDSPCRISSPTLENGDPVIQKSGVVAEQLGDVKELTSTISDGGTWCDFLLSLSSSCLTLHDRVYSPLKERFDESFRPFRVILPNHNRNYWHLVPFERHVIVDFANADIVYFDDIEEPDYAKRVLRWAVDDSKVPETSIFSDELALTVVTDEFRKRLEELRPSGVELIALADLHEPLLGT